MKKLLFILFIFQVIALVSMQNHTNENSIGKSLDLYFAISISVLPPLLYWIYYDMSSTKKQIQIKKNMKQNNDFISRYVFLSFFTLLSFTISYYFFIVVIPGVIFFVFFEGERTKVEQLFKLKNQKPTQIEKTNEDFGKAALESLIKKKQAIINPKQANEIENFYRKKYIFPKNDKLNKNLHKKINDWNEIDLDLLSNREYRRKILTDLFEINTRRISEQGLDEHLRRIINFWRKAPRNQWLQIADEYLNKSLATEDEIYIRRQININMILQEQDTVKQNILIDIELKKDPNHLDLYNFKAYNLYKIGKIKLGINTILEAIKRDPKKAPYYDTIGEGYSMLKDYDKAIMYMNIGIETAPDGIMSNGDHFPISDHYYNRGIAYSNSFNYNKANKDFLMALSIDSGFEEARSSLIKNNIICISKEYKKLLDLSDEHSEDGNANFISYDFAGEEIKNDNHLDITLLIEELKKLKKTFNSITLEEIKTEIINSEEGQEVINKIRNIKGDIAKVKKDTPTNISALSDDLTKLGELKEKGLLTEEEFNEQKKKLLKQ